jgi:uncharacterized phage protein (TIGR01671 family)
MNTEFRGIRVDNGKMVKGDLVNGVGVKEDKIFILPLSEQWVEGANDMNGFEVIPETVGQYTGLKDKNGKESWEGDIYHLDDFTDEYVMTWDFTSARFYLKSVHGGCDKDARLVTTGECIGNIHQNPELLKGGGE